MNRWSSLLNNYRDVRWQEGALFVNFIRDKNSGWISITRQETDILWKNSIRVFYFQERRYLKGTEFWWTGEAVHEGTCIGIANIPEDIRELLRPLLKQLPFRIKDRIDAAVADDQRRISITEQKRLELLKAISK